MVSSAVEFERRRKGSGEGNYSFRDMAESYCCYLAAGTEIAVQDG